MSCLRRYIPRQQDTDFLGVIFHQYLSDDGEDSEDDSLRRTRELEQRCVVNVLELTTDTPLDS